MGKMSWRNDNGEDELIFTFVQWLMLDGRTEGGRESGWTCSVKRTCSNKSLSQVQLFLMKIWEA
jgi:hypothetical protein